MMQQILQYPIVRARRLRAALRQLQPASRAQESVRAQERDPQHPSTAGQALVEFALVLMFVILPFTFVLIDGSMVLFTLASMTNAAREAAHAGSIFQETTYTSQYATIDADRLTYIKQEAQSFASPLIPFSQCVTTVVYNPQTPDTYNIYRALDSMSVTLACPHRLFFGLVGTGQITLTAQSTMRIEPGGVALPPIP